MRRGQRFSRLAAALVIGAAVAAPIRGNAQAPATNQPLRVCADPDDLPFSSAKSGTPGIYVELGQQIAQSLGRPFEPVWALSYFGKRAVRTTLLAKTCDVYVGLPGIKGFMGPQLVYSKPFLHIGYAIMAPAGEHITKLDDLAGKRVAVQFSTPPQIVLAERDDVKSMTFLNPEEAVKALEHHDVDVAFIWGPVAGYINRTALHGAYDVTPIAGEGMQYPVKIGFIRANAELRDQIDKVLEESHPAVVELAAKYGLPTAAPIELARLADEPMMILASTSETETAPQTQQATASPTPSNDPAPDAVAEGHAIFNGTCSHCHGPDAVQSVRKIDLRLLHHRYGDTTETVFHETVTKGRPSKGMPNWSKVFSEDDFKKIYAYLSTIQTD
jgi:ABC-type amino acid transport substrate-binding protein/mono/diheme cytochrome c family protein